MWLFSFRRYCQTVCRTKWLFQLTSPSARFESFPQSPSSHHFTWSSFPFSPSNVKRHCVVVLICISLVTKEVEHHFIYYWLFRNFLFVKWLFKSLLSFFYCFFCWFVGVFLYSGSISFVTYILVPAAARDLLASASAAAGISSARWEKEGVEYQFTSASAVSRVLTVLVLILSPGLWCVLFGTNIPLIKGCKNSTENSQVALSQLCLMLAFYITIVHASKPGN